ncbi:MAG: ATP-binding protein [Vicinamibacterales bacterium]
MNFRHRVSTLIAVRVVVCTLLFGSALLVALNRPGTFPVDQIFFLIGLTYTLSVVYFATLPFVDRWPWLVDAQLGIDTFLVSAFIHVTGGIPSAFSSLYLLLIIAASMMRFRRAALQVATLSAVLYLGIVAVQFTDAMQQLPAFWQVQVPAQLPTLRFTQYTVSVNLFGFFAVALLSGSLADRLRSAGERLKDASNEIEDLRAFNEYVIDSLLSGLATADTDCRLLTFNRTASLITGISTENAVGRDVGAVLQLPPDVRARVGALQETRSLRIDFEYQTQDRRRLEIGLTASAVVFPHGRHGFLFTFQDVTDVKRLERHARLQQRLAAVGEMAAGIAHEIRNPLASMSGSIQVLRQELTLNDDQAQLMEIVLRESERLNDTIHSFLAYARPQRFAVSRLDVAKVVQDTALLLRNSAGVRDDHEVAVEVPQGPVWYEADENQIRQILWNLATNGLRAMPNGGRLLLSVSTERTGAQQALVVSVQDRGCGIPADEIDGIFEPFRSSFEKGTGLGLAIVHRIVTDYNGVIQVSSALGAGTTVRVRLPIRASTGGAVTTTESQVRSAAR